MKPTRHYNTITVLILVGVLSNCLLAIFKGADFNAYAQSLNVGLAFMFQICEKYEQMLDKFRYPIQPDTMSNAFDYDPT